MISAPAGFKLGPEDIYYEFNCQRPDGYSGKKHIVTSIEYDTPSEASQDEVFSTVREILADNLDAFSKITFDLVDGGEKVRVEVTENRK
ncbi:hypothetical protein [Allobaculum sp. Allo2]|uniref:hypothetical protein n=1 Tax=Allobaculum sp. Allo2 TaxID=2853432 RepID=UPI001F6025AB|nr:hypothetical protein [Allobaculum sp. Allo2]